MIFGEWSQFGSMLNAGRGVRSTLSRLISELLGSQSAEGNSPNGGAADLEPVDAFLARLRQLLHCRRDGRSDR